MKRKHLIWINCIIFGVASQALAVDKIVSCPALSVKQFGKSIYYDPKIGRLWNLSWQNKQTPVWDNISIPQTTTCAASRSRSGISLVYQCAVFQCKSDAVTATLEQNQALKCFSAYVSTQNKFYCGNFSAS